MEITLIILSITLLLTLSYIVKLLSKIEKLKEKMNSMEDTVDQKVKQLEKQIKQQEELISIEPGDRAIVPNFGLCYKDQDNFHVTYEVEIVEVSVDKVKVKSIDFASTDTIAKDPKRKQGILDFVDGEWLSKKDIELVVDDQMRRDKKLNQILS